MSIKPIKPMGKSVNSPRWGKLILDAVIVLLVCVLGALLLIEWAAGCGETYTDAQGVEHQNECVFLELKK
jgi:hypothetical protein